MQKYTLEERHEVEGWEWARKDGGHQGEGKTGGQENEAKMNRLAADLELLPSLLPPLPL